MTASRPQPPANAIRTTCPYCGVGCGVLARPDGAGGATIAGDPDHPANAGRLCSKGSALGETLGLEGRLLHPEIDGVPTDWDSAIDAVAGGFAQAIARHGPEAVAVYVSGQLLTEDYYAANKFAKSVLGTGNIDSNSRLCMSSAVAGHKRAFGEDLVPVDYADLDTAGLIVLVGSNTAWCHPIIYQRIIAARAANPGLRLVVIDPRRTATCQDADLHLAIAPDADVALFAGLLVYLHDTGHADADFIANHASGLAAALDAARASTADIAATASTTGLQAEDVARFFAWFAANPRVVTLFSQGVNQSASGTDKVNAIINVHLLTGRIGRPGAGPFSITGQPNAMGGREVGALANLLAGHLEWDRPGDVARLRRFWGAPALPDGPGLKAVELFAAIGAGRVRAVWIIGTNPLVSLPDADAARQALAGCPLVVLSDCMRETDTADLAHIRLPALGWGEKDGSVTNSDRTISRQRGFLSPPGQARPDWRIIADVATKMGHGARFAWNSPADVFREHAALSGFENDGARQFDISALNALGSAGYADLRPVAWPLGRGRLFADGRFSTPDGRARFIPTLPRPAAFVPNTAFPLVLLTGRVRDQWHSMTRTGKSPRLLAHMPEPLLEVHPEDAPGIADGTLALLHSAWGEALLRIRHDAGLRRGTVFAPMHWTLRFCPTGRVNQAVAPATDPISGQPALKHTPVRLSAFAAGWYGFILARQSLGTSLGTGLGTGLTAYCATLPAAANVWRHELAGTEPPARALLALRATVSAALGVAGEWITLSDATAGQHRAALIRNHRLEACIFLAPHPQLPPRGWLVELLAQDRLSATDRRFLLAGAQANGPAPEAPICVCHGVGATAINAAIAAGADTLDAVGARTRAGTNCGSCRPEIRTLLAAQAAILV